MLLPNQSIRMRHGRGDTDNQNQRNSTKNHVLEKFLPNKSKMRRWSRNERTERAPTRGQRARIKKSGRIIFIIVFALVHFIFLDLCQDIARYSWKACMGFLLHKTLICGGQRLGKPSEKKTHENRIKTLKCKKWNDSDLILRTWTLLLLSPIYFFLFAHSFESNGTKY